jgi:serine/threonine protein kinase
MATKVAPLGRHGLPTDLLDAIESFGYKLGDFVGKGSFSLVFAALDPDGRSVALKIINDTCKEKRVFNECNHLCRAGCVPFAV